MLLMKLLVDRKISKVISAHKDRTPIQSWGAGPVLTDNVLLQEEAKLGILGQDK